MCESTRTLLTRNDKVIGPRMIHQNQLFTINQHLYVKIKKKFQHWSLGNKLQFVIDAINTTLCCRVRFGPLSMLLQIEQVFLGRYNVTINRASMVSMIVSTIDGATVCNI